VPDLFMALTTIHDALQELLAIRGEGMKGCR
jgi:hypothetical protein